MAGSDRAAIQGGFGIIFN